MVESFLALSLLQPVLYDTRACKKSALVVQGFFPCPNEANQLVLVGCAKQKLVRFRTAQERLLSPFLRLLGATDY